MDGRCTEPVKLGIGVNSTESQYNAFVAPDEGCLIVSTGGGDDTLGGNGYYVVFRCEDDSWGAPASMGPEVNTPGNGEFSPYVSPDGRYLFFMSSRRTVAGHLPDVLSWDFLWDVHTESGNGNADIYWIDAGFIEHLRPDRG